MYRSPTKMITQKYHSFSFYDRNKYKPLANDNPNQYLESWIYDPNNQIPKDVKT